MIKWFYRLMGFGCILDDVKEENSKKSKYDARIIVSNDMRKNLW